MPRDHAHWEEHEVKLLLTLAIQEKEKFNWNQFGLTREGWRNIYPHFPQYSHKQINNKFDFLKQKYRAWKDSQVATGLGRNTQTGGIDADPDYWMAQDGSQPIDDDFPHAGETSNAAAARGNPPPFLNELHALFGDRNTNTGIYLSGGGIGSETPPHVMSQNDYSGPSSYHSGSKRARGDHVVDSPRKKCCEILGRISDSIAARSSSRDRQRTREQEEVDEAMEILEADGVPIPSDLYFTALELFKNSCWLYNVWLAVGEFKLMLYELKFLCAGRYYLVDSGYANREGYMPPYPCMRYHVKEFKKGSPRHAQELFNKYHSRLRNVIERTFGCAKSKWQLLNGIPHYPLIKQSQLVMAACALHNYVHELEGRKRPARYRQRGVGGSLGQVLAMALSPDATTEEIRDWITLGLPLLEKK